MYIETRTRRDHFDLIVRNNDKEATIEEDISVYRAPDYVVPEKYPEKFLATTIEMLEFNYMDSQSIAAWFIERLPTNILAEIKDALNSEVEE